MITKEQGHPNKACFTKKKFQDSKIGANPLGGYNVMIDPLFKVLCCRNASSSNLVEL